MKDGPSLRPRIEDLSFPLSSGCGWRLPTELCPAVGAVRPAMLHRFAALWATGLEGRAAVGTESKLCRCRYAAFRARQRQRVTQDKIQDDADAVGDEDRQ